MIKINLKGIWVLELHPRPWPKYVINLFIINWVYVLFVFIVSFLMAEEDPHLSSNNVSIAQREVRHHAFLSDPGVFVNMDRIKYIYQI